VFLIEKSSSKNLFDIRCASSVRAPLPCTNQGAQQATESSTLICWSYGYCLNYLKTNQMSLSNMTQCHQAALMWQVVNARERKVV